MCLMSMIVSLPRRGAIDIVSQVFQWPAVAVFGFFDLVSLPCRKLIYLKNVKAILSKQKSMQEVMHFLLQAG